MGQGHGLSLGGFLMLDLVFENSFMFGLGGMGFLGFDWSFGLDVFGLGRGSIVLFGLEREFRHVAVRGVNVLGPVAERSGIVPHGASGTLLQVRQAVVAPVILNTKKKKMSAFA